MFTDNFGSLYIYGSSIYMRKSVTFLNSHMQSEIEGCITLLLSKLVILKGAKVRIMNNTAQNGGGLLALSSNIDIFESTVDILDNTASGMGGGMYLYQSKLYIEGDVRIRNNHANLHGGGIHAMSTAILIHSTRTLTVTVRLILDSNRASKGGGAYLAAYTQFYITQLFNNEVRNAIQLCNNSARYGGALYVDDRTYKGACSSGAGKSSTRKYNASSVDFKNSSIMDISLSECFFQVVMMTSKNYTFSDAFTYSGNAANVSGPLLYGGLLDRCTLYVFSDSHHIQFSQTPRSSSSIYNITSSSPVRVCQCNNSVVNCEHQKVQVFVSKGEWFSLHVTAVD